MLTKLLGSHCTFSLSGESSLIIWGHNSYKRRKEEEEKVRIETRTGSQKHSEKSESLLLSQAELWTGEMKTRVKHIHLYVKVHFFLCNTLTLVSFDYFTT